MTSRDPETSSALSVWFWRRCRNFRFNLNTGPIVLKRYTCT